ncbi:hypothetical protein DV515_00007932, partial [Chloebia gouldiae]
MKTEAPWSESVIVGRYLDFAAAYIVWRQDKPYNDTLTSMTSSYANHSEYLANC